VISKPIIDELLAVLAEKFDRNVEELARTALFLSDLARLVKPRAKLAVLSDEPDNRILECGSVGGADIIVTGEKAMLLLNEYDGTQIITVRRYLSDKS